MLVPQPKGEGVMIERTIRNRARGCGGLAGRGVARRCGAWLGLMLACVVGPAWASGEPEAGQEIAARWCASCHATTGDPGTRTDVTPSFPAIAAKPTTSELSLRVFLQTPHDRMPDLQLSRQETDDLVAYLLSLRRR